MSNPSAAGCWWLDGTGGFARECRVCTDKAPEKSAYANDWAFRFRYRQSCPRP